MGLIVAMVLLVVLAAISTSILKDFQADRRERLDDMMHAQAILLADGCLDRAVRIRQTTPDFEGETFVFGREFHTLPGTFSVSTLRDGPGDGFRAHLEYRDDQGKPLYRCIRSADEST